MDGLDWLVPMETLTPRHLIFVNHFKATCHPVPVDQCVDDGYLTHATCLHRERNHVVLCVIEAQVDDLLLALLEKFDSPVEELLGLSLAIRVIAAFNDTQLVVLEEGELVLHIDRLSELLQLCGVGEEVLEVIASDLCSGESLIKSSTDDQNTLEYLHFR